MTKMSGHKEVKAHMSKLRCVYKGEDDHIVEYGGENVSLKDFHNSGTVNAHQNQENVVNQATDKDAGVPNFSYYGHDPSSQV